jgi:hypothetical protein
VGETKRAFWVRYKEHLADIRHSRDSPVARHFNLPNHHSNHVKPQIIEFLTGDPENDESTIKRRERELHWIHQLRTFNPSGINKLY